MQYSKGMLLQFLFEHACINDQKHVSVLIFQLTIWMEHSRHKPHRWWFIWIIFRKLKTQFERTCRFIIKKKEKDTHFDKSEYQEH